VPIVTLYVGPANATYHVHLALLCHASTVLKKAFTGLRYQEAARGSMDMIDDDVDAVDRFVQWLYSKKYQLSRFDVDEKTANERFHELAKLNTFADKYNIGDLTNDIIDRMWEPWNLFADHLLSSKLLFCPRMSLVAYVYDNTNDNSSFRQLMVAWYAWEISLTWYDHAKTKEALSDVSQDFVVDLAMVLGQRIGFEDRTSPFALPKEVFYVGLGEVDGEIEGVRMTQGEED